jgi:hypothetical protein
VAKRCVKVQHDTMALVPQGWYWTSCQNCFLYGFCISIFWKLDLTAKCFLYRAMAFWSDVFVLVFWRRQTSKSSRHCNLTIDHDEPAGLLGQALLENESRKYFCVWRSVPSCQHGVPNPYRTNWKIPKSPFSSSPSAASTEGLPACVHHFEEGALHVRAKSRFDVERWIGRHDWRNGSAGECRQLRAKVVDSNLTMFDGDRGPNDWPIALLLPACTCIGGPSCWSQGNAYSLVPKRAAMFKTRDAFSDRRWWRHGASRGP